MKEVQLKKFESVKIGDFTVFTNGSGELFVKTGNSPTARLSSRDNRFNVSLSGNNRKAIFTPNELGMQVEYR